MKLERGVGILPCFQAEKTRRDDCLKRSNRIEEEDDLEQSS